jgi:hypothetical protein
MKKIVFRSSVLLVFIALSGCGGSKVLKEPEPLVVTQALATASDEQLSVTLDWVIVRDGPGTWARNVDWDEYLIRVQNLGDSSLEITNVSVVDSLEIRIESGNSRRELVKGTKEAKRRYKGEGLKVKAGAGAGTMLVAGAATGAAAVSLGAGAILGSSAVAGAAIGGLVLAPVLAVGGVFRGVNNSKVSNQIELRQTLLPVDVPGEEEKTLDIFFPLTPSPRQIEVTYLDSRGDHTLIVDTHAALEGLHLVQDAE